MQAFLEGHTFFAGMAVVLLLLSIVCRFRTGMLLKKLIQEAESMSATEDAQLKQCKLKFQNYYALNDGSMNVAVFVEKFMQGIRIGGCSLRMRNLLSGQLLLLSVFADGVGACLGILRGETLGQILPFYLLAFLSLYLHFSVSGLLDIPGQQAELKTTVTDFLENRMTERIRSVQQDSAYLEAEEEKALAAAGKTREAAEETNSEESAEDLPYSGLTGDFMQETIKKEPKRELEQLLHEFLA